MPKCRFTRRCIPSLFIINLEAFRKKDVRERAKGGQVGGRKREFHIYTKVNSTNSYPRNRKTNQVKKKQIKEETKMEIGIANKLCC